MYCQAATRPRTASSTVRSPRPAGFLYRFLGKYPRHHAALRPPEKRILVAVVKTQPEPEPVGERYLFLDCFFRLSVQRTGASSDHVSRHQVTPVGRCVEHHVLRPDEDPAFEQQLVELYVVSSPSNDRSSQNRMNFLSLRRRTASSRGSEARSSRWISTSTRAPDARPRRSCALRLTTNFCPCRAHA